MRAVNVLTNFSMKDCVIEEAAAEGYANITDGSSEIYIPIELLTIFMSSRQEVPVPDLPPGYEPYQNDEGWYLCYNDELMDGIKGSNSEEDAIKIAWNHYYEYKCTPDWQEFLLANGAPKHDPDLIIDLF